MPVTSPDLLILIKYFSTITVLARIIQLFFLFPSLPRPPPPPSVFLFPPPLLLFFFYFYLFKIKIIFILPLAFIIFPIVLCPIYTSRRIFVLFNHRFIFLDNCSG